jgi:Holliday junction resolvase RusA-like endonuclease
MSLEWDFELILDGEPIGKGRPRFSRQTGHTYTPEKTARFEERLAWAAQSTMQRRPLFDGPLRVLINAYFSIPASKPAKWRLAAMEQKILPTKKPDIDNVIKGVADALNKVVYVDDTQIVSLAAGKFYSDRPRIEIFIRHVS